MININKYFQIATLAILIGTAFMSYSAYQGNKSDKYLEMALNPPSQYLDGLCTGLLQNYTNNLIKMNNITYEQSTYTYNISLLFFSFGLVFSIFGLLSKN